MKHDDLIEPIEKFGFKDPLRFIENLVAHRIVIVSLSRCTESHYRLLLQQLSADVRGHDDDRVPEIDLST